MSESDSEGATFSASGRERTAVAPCGKVRLVFLFGEVSENEVFIDIMIDTVRRV